MKSRRLYLYLGLFLLLLLLGATLGVELLTQVSPYYADSRVTALEPMPPFAPSARHWLGTDGLGRDLWSRILFGARWSLLFAAVVAFGRILLALPFAWLAVVGPRPFRWLVERLYVLTNTVPPLLLYLILLAVPGVRLIGLLPSLALTLTLLTLWEWPRLAGTMKGRMEQLMQEGYIEGAVAAGAGPGRLFRVHLLPHLMPLLLRVGVGEMGQVLLTVAHLGLFGVWIGGGSLEIVENARGSEVKILTTSIPEWGTLLSEARVYLRSAPWVPLAPAAAFFLAITAFHLLAQGLEAIPVRVRHLRWWGLGLAGVAALVLSFGYLQVREVLATGPAIASLQSGERVPPPSAYMELKGFETNLMAFYVPWDSSEEAFQRRFYVNRIAFAADRAALRVREVMGAEVLGRPVLRLYPTEEAFAAATGGAAGTWAITGDEIAIAPTYATGKVTKELIRALVYTEIEAGTHRVSTPDPLALGRMELALAELTPYRPDWQLLIGERLPRLTELYDGTARPGEKRYMTAAALLVEWRPALTAAEAPSLAAQFDAYLYERLVEHSMLTVPAVRREFPPGLLATFEAESQGSERLLMHALKEGDRYRVMVLAKEADGVKLSAERWAESGGDWVRLP